MAALPQHGQQAVSRKKERTGPDLGERIKRGLATSVWVTIIWEWFLSLVTRAIQPLLFTTVMYNLASTYPGVKTPGNVDLIVFIAQNAALDIASFGLPSLASQAEQAGNEQGANDARKLAKHLFYIMIANLIWGGVEHVFTSVDSNVKLFIALAFVIIRSFYAIKYSQVIHSLKTEAAHEEMQSIAPQENDLRQQIADFKRSIDAMQQKIDLSSAPEQIDYQQIAAHVAPLVTAQDIPAQPQPIDYHEVAQHIAPLLVPPPVPTTQEIIEELKPYLETLKPVAQSVPPERITQANIQAVHPLTVPTEEKKDSLYVPPRYAKSVRTQDTLTVPGQQAGIPQPVLVGTPESVRKTVPTTVRKDTLRTEKSVRDRDAKSVRKDTARTPESVRKGVPGQSVQDSVNDRLKRGYEEMKKKNMDITGRKLAAYTGINKNTACTWFRDNVQQNQDSENEGVRDTVNQ